MGKNKNKPAQAGTNQPVANERRFVSLREEAQGNVAQQWAPPRQLSERELVACRKMFYDLDNDNSGAIDADELGSMMRTLGQDPSEEECKELIASVDDPNSPDGMIQFREFCLLYAQGLDSKDKAGCLDSLNIFTAFGGDPRQPEGRVALSTIAESLLEMYGLEVDFTDTFGFMPKPEGLTQDDFKSILGTH